MLRAHLYKGSAADQTHMVTCPVYSLQYPSVVRQLSRKLSSLGDNLFHQRLVFSGVTSTQPLTSTRGKPRPTSSSRESQPMRMTTGTVSTSNASMFLATWMPEPVGLSKNLYFASSHHHVFMLKDANSTPAARATGLRTSVLFSSTPSQPRKRFLAPKAVTTARREELLGGKRISKNARSLMYSMVVSFSSHPPTAPRVASTPLVFAERSPRRSRAKSANCRSSGALSISWTHSRSMAIVYPQHRPMGATCTPSSMMSLVW
mmetsp:Transcript_81590/g.197734  ORF Transcript_81590/g.197734 Transcript_81590/m.197734 type:complete len:261 (-) Transcript_81590:661-1443(-)